MLKTLYTILLSSLIAVGSFKHVYAQHSFVDQEHDLIGIGISQVDMTVVLTDEALKRNFTVPYNIKKGALNIVNNKTIEALKPYFKDAIITPGGEVATVLCNFSRLGGSAAIDSRFAGDAYGKLFMENLNVKGVSLLSEKKIWDKEDTTFSINLITQDAVKTTLLHVGKSGRVSEHDISYNLLKNGKYILLEGALWSLESKVIKRAINAAYKLDAKTIFMLSDVLFVKEFRSQFQDILKEINILVGSMSEMKALFDTNSIDTVIENIKKYNIIGVITLGADGAILVNKDEVIQIPAYNAQGAILDKSGVESAFTAGLLYGITNGKSLEQSGDIASKTAALTIRQLGSNPAQNLSELIR